MAASVTANVLDPIAFKNMPNYKGKNQQLVWTPPRPTSSFPPPNCLTRRLGTRPRLFVDRGAEMIVRNQKSSTLWGQTEDYHSFIIWALIPWINVKKTANADQIWRRFAIVLSLTSVTDVNDGLIANCSRLKPRKTAARQLGCFGSAKIKRRSTFRS